MSYPNAINFAPFSLPGDVRFANAVIRDLESKRLTISVAGQNLSVLAADGTHRNAWAIEYRIDEPSHQPLLTEFVDAETGAVLFASTTTSRLDWQELADPKPLTAPGLSWFVAGEAPLLGITAAAGPLENHSVVFSASPSPRWVDLAAMIRTQGWYSDVADYRVEEWIHMEEVGPTEHSCSRTVKVTIPERQTTPVFMAFKEGGWPVTDALGTPTILVSGSGPALPTFRLDTAPVSVLGRAGPAGERGFLAASDGVFKTDYRTALDAAMENADVASWFAIHTSASLGAARYFPFLDQSDFIDQWDLAFGTPEQDGSDLHVVVRKKADSPLNMFLGGFDVASHVGHIHSSGVFAFYAEMASLNEMVRSYNDAVGGAPDSLHCDLFEGFCGIGNRDDLGWPAAEGLVHEPVTYFGDQALARNGLTFHAQNGRLMHASSVTLSET